MRLATAESCTGGLIAGCLTEIAGSSAVVDRGYVVYDNRAKVEMLGVREATLAADGAVSEATAREMVEGALARSGCGLAVAVTGIAGPGGGSEAKPVGLVHIAAATPRRRRSCTNATYSRATAPRSGWPRSRPRWQLARQALDAGARS